MDLKSGTPFWPIRDGLTSIYPPLERNQTCDVAVIGGGITGALIAFHLAEAGLHTVVLDKRDIGWGSTSATTALLQYEIDTPLHELIEMIGERNAVRSYLACRDGIDKLEHLVSKLHIACEFKRKKSLYVGVKKADIPALQREYVARQRAGFKLNWLDQSDLTQLFSFSRPAGIMSYDAAQMDAYHCAHALLQAAIRHGAHVHDRTNVTEIEHHRNGVRLHTDRNAIVRAKHLVFATGFESERYLNKKVAKLISTYALASEPLANFDGWHDRCLIWEMADPYLYLRTSADGRVIMGGEDEEFRNPKRRDELIGQKTKRLHQKFNKLFPQLPMEVAFAWAGTFAKTKDGLAYIGAAPNHKRTYFALGYGGNGITYSILAAEIIRDAILGKTNPYADLFRFDRG